ncbi:MAG: hypothetical protein BWY76_03264 [bacterium ADurb.Bin429]|nr:MAG: hypothetical protein BWY76_03264 [bacterium ADurb.Bin429]
MHGERADAIQPPAREAQRIAHYHFAGAVHRHPQWLAGAGDEHALLIPFHQHRHFSMTLQTGGLVDQMVEDFQNAPAAAALDEMQVTLQWIAAEGDGARQLAPTAQAAGSLPGEDASRDQRRQAEERDHIHIERRVDEADEEKGQRE